MQTGQEQASALEWRARMNGERAATTGDADEGLIARFLAGDPSAFDALFLKYQEYVYNIVYGILGKTEEARDITQDVFLQVYRSLPTFRRGSRFATWLYRIAVNRAVDAARSARRWQWFPLHEMLRAKSDPTDNPAQVSARHAEQEVVQQILMQLPLKHRDVLVLRYYQDLSLEEIAEVLGCTVQAAKVRLHRARQHFKEKYLAAFEQEERATKPLR